MENLAVVSSIISLIVFVFVIIQINKIAENTKETKRFNNMAVLLLKKLLEQKGETVDLKELYQKVS